MIEQAIKAICKLSDGAGGATSVRAEQEPQGTYYHVHGGRCERVEAAPKERAHQFSDLGSLVACTKRLAGGMIAATVWVSRGGVSVLLNDHDRRDRAVLRLSPSPQMKTLEGWSAATVWLDQAALVRVLRGTFAHSVRGTQLVETFRRLKMRLTATGESEVQQVSLAEDVFDGGAMGIREEVPCAVEIDVKAEKIAICPLAGAVEAAWIRAEQRLAAKVCDLLGEGTEHVSVYLGAP